MADDVKLLPCPFCGEAKNLLVEHLEGTIIHPAYQVRCDNCGASSGYTDKDCRADWNTRTQAAEIEALRAKTAVTMGVGSGDGELFVHGDYESIKAAQEIVLRAERLAEALRHLRNHTSVNSHQIELIDAALHPTPTEGAGRE